MLLLGFEHVDPQDLDKPSIEPFEARGDLRRLPLQLFFSGPRSAGKQDGSRQAGVCDGEPRGDVGSLAVAEDKDLVTPDLLMLSQEGQGCGRVGEGVIEALLPIVTLASPHSALVVSK